jgi:hypothetical protein
MLQSVVDAKALLSRPMLSKSQSSQYKKKESKKTTEICMGYVEVMHGRERRTRSRLECIPIFTPQKHPSGKVMKHGEECMKVCGKQKKKYFPNRSGLMRTSQERMPSTSSSRRRSSSGIGIKRSPIERSSLTGNPAHTASATGKALNLETIESLIGADSG